MDRIAVRVIAPGLTKRALVALVEAAPEELRRADSDNSAVALSAGETWRAEMEKLSGLRERAPVVLVLEREKDGVAAREAWKAGVRTFVGTADEDAAVFVCAVHAARCGAVYFSPTLASAARRAFSEDGPTVSAAALETLSAREREVGLLIS